MGHPGLAFVASMWSDEMRTCCFGLAFGLFAVATSTHAAGESPDTDDVMAAQLRKSIAKENGAGPLDRPVSLFDGVQLTADKGASTASIKMSSTGSYSRPQRSDKKPWKPGDALPPSYFDLTSYTVSAPVSKSGDTTKVASLDGLANAASIEVRFTRFIMFGRKAADFEGAINQICNLVLEKMADKDRPADSGCDSSEVAQYSPDQLAAFRNAGWDTARRLVLGGNAKLGYQDFEYVEASSAQKKTQNETPWVLGGIIGYSLAEQRAVATLGFQYQHAFKEGDNGTVCPASTGGAVTCVTDPVNKPKQTDKKILTLDGRQLYSFGGLGLTLNRDFESRVWGVEIPYNFIKDKDGKLIGGVKAGWRSDTHVTTIGVYVGTAFQLY